MSSHKEAIEDDLQLKIDNFFDILTNQAVRSARTFVQNSLRAVMVDFPHEDPKKIKAIYKKLIKEALKVDNSQYYDDKWQKILLLELD